MSMIDIKNKKASSTSLDQFFLTFVGEYVSVIGEFTSIGEKGAVTATGYLLDTDDLFYYLGSGADNIDTAIKKTSVHCIEIIKERDLHMEILDKMDIPEDGTKIN